MSLLPTPKPAAAPCTATGESTTADSAAALKPTAIKESRGESKAVGCRSLCSSPDVDACRSRLGEYAAFWIKTGHSHRIINMLNMVQNDVLHEDSVLSLHCLTALAYEQRFEQADRFLDEWLAHIRNNIPTDPAEFLRLQLRLTSSVVILQILRGDLSLISEDKIHHLKQTLDIPSEHQGVLNNIYAYLLFMNGKYAKAQQAAARAYQISIQDENWFVRAIAVLLQCLCDRAQGRFDIAYKSVLAAIQAYEVVNDTPAWAVLGLVRAMFEYEINHLSAAENLLQKAMPKLAMSAISDFRVNASITLARVHTSQLKYAEAECVLAELLDVISKGNDRRWTDYITHERMRVAALSGKRGLYAQWRENAATPTAETGVAMRTKYCPAVGHVPERTLLMLALQEGDFAAAESALGQLGKMCSLQDDSFLRVVVLSGSASLAYGRNNHDQAIVFLNRALGLCKQTQLYRTLFDENFGFAQVFYLTRELGRFDDDIDTELLKKLSLETFPQPQRYGESSTKAAPVGSTEACIESLTDTETRVLDLLSQGLSNKDISRRLGIAVTTTKWHLKNIFGKLATSNRVGAVVRARELQLLSVMGECALAFPNTILSVLL